MKSDISSRKNIKFIISEFYSKLLVDEIMLPFFEEIVEKNHLDQHLEIITDFWQDILLGTILYQNNTMQKHTDKHVFMQFKEEHFTLWISYLFDTIDSHFEGLNVSKMKARATSIATVMKLKMDVYKK